MNGAGSKIWLWDSTNNIWVKAAGTPTGALSIHAIVEALNDIEDVNVPTPTDGYILYWDATAGKWQAKLISATTIIDADGDTKVQVEESADEDKIRMDVAGVEAFLLDNSGILNLDKQSMARAHLERAFGSYLSIPDATWTKVEYEDEDYDPQNEYDPTTNYRFTATKAGKYMVTLCIEFQNLPDGTRCLVDLYKNGVATARCISSVCGAATAAGGAGAIVVDLAANDYLEGFVYQNAGEAKDISGYGTNNVFSITKMA